MITVGSCINCEHGFEVVFYNLQFQVSCKTQYILVLKNSQIKRVLSKFSHSKSLAKLQDPGVLT